jgi:hypothetical protein
MGCKSTYGISRENAIRVLISSVYKVSDEELAGMLEALNESEYRNYRIEEVGDGSPYIASAEEFFRDDDYFNKED